MSTMLKLAAALRILETVLPIDRGDKAILLEAATAVEDNDVSEELVQAEIKAMPTAEEVAALIVNDASIRNHITDAVEVAVSAAIAKDSPTINTIIGNDTISASGGLDAVIVPE